MSNAVLDRLLEQRAEQETFIDQLLAKVEEEKRDLVDAEKANLTSVRERIAAIDAQIKPLEEYEATRAEHRANAPRPNQGTQGGRRMSVDARDVRYPTPGHYMADLVRSKTHYVDQVEQRPDAEAAQRVAAARETAKRDLQAKGIQTRAAGDVAPGDHITTDDTPGLLPVTIQGTVEEQLDGARMFLPSIGIKDLSGIPGKTFDRPHITQHVETADQAAEKAELISGELKIDGIPFTKKTHGGWVNVSRQEIDWTSPAAWNIILNDLQAVYAENTDDGSAAGFAAGVTQHVDIATADAGVLDEWVDALYDAAAMAATANGTKRASARRLPTTIWASLDMWSMLGKILTKAAIKENGIKSAGAATPTAFSGSILDVPRIMAPGLPAGTLIIGRPSQFEYYEQRIGLLSAIEPKVFGMQIAYGGYYAYGFLDKSSFAKITLTA